MKWPASHLVSGLMSCILATLLSDYASTGAQPVDSVPAQPGFLKSEFIFEQAPFRSCHASTIVETRDGLMAAWFGGTREGARDVGIWLARHDGKAWSEPFEIANGADDENHLRYPCWNPVLFQPKNGPLLLFYKVGPKPSSWWGMLMKSNDGGRTWSRPARSGRYARTRKTSVTFFGSKTGNRAGSRKPTRICWQMNAIDLRRNFSSPTCTAPRTLRRATWRLPASCHC